MEYIEKKRVLFFGLPLTFTKYIVKEDMIIRQKGLFKTEEDECYMYKVSDIRYERSLFEKMFGLGTIKCFTGGDVTDQNLELTHIKNSREIKEFISKTSEAERLKRRTLNTQNISAHMHLDSDDSIHDDFEVHDHS